MPENMVTTSNVMAGLQPTVAASDREPIKFTGKLSPGYVKVRITKKGDRKIHIGGTAKSLSSEGVKFDAATQELFPTFRHNDETALPIAIAQAQEDNGFVEIQD